MAANSYVCNITPAQADDLRGLLSARGWEFSTLPYAKFKASGDHVSAVVYESGKLVVQGRNMEDFVLIDE